MKVNALEIAFFLKIISWMDMDSLDSTQWRSRVGGPDGSSWKNQVLQLKNDTLGQSGKNS